MLEDVEVNAATPLKVDDRFPKLSRASKVTCEEEIPAVTV
jgi:hypothetical protein